MSYNYYDLLNVPADASQEEIKLAFEEAIKLYSSENLDITTLFTKDESRMFLRILEEAYSILGNSTLRELYDSKRTQVDIRNSELTAEALLVASEMQQKQIAKAKEEQFVVDEAFERSLQACAEWNGEQLKRVRTYKKISIETLFEKIKINPWYITAIEAMDSQNLPAPVFVRGYVVQIAKFLGLNEKLVADSYMKSFGKSSGSK